MSLDSRLETLLAARQGEALPDAETRRLARQRSGLTQADLARLLGVSRPALTRWENGSRLPRGKNRAAYARVLGRLLKSSGGHNQDERDATT